MSNRWDEADAPKAPNAKFAVCVAGMHAQNGFMLPGPPLGSFDSFSDALAFANEVTSEIGSHGFGYLILHRNPRPESKPGWTTMVAEFSAPFFGTIQTGHVVVVDLSTNAAREDWRHQLNYSLGVVPYREVRKWMQRFVPGPVLA